MNTDKLLDTLGWPSAHRSEKGTLTWNGPVGDDTLDAHANSLMVTPSMVRARLIRVSVSGPQPPHFEATWAIAPDADPVLKSVVYAGEKVDQDEDWAVKTFRDLVELVQGRPAFQTMGQRWKVQPNAALKI